MTGLELLFYLALLALIIVLIIFIISFMCSMFTFWGKAAREREQAEAKEAEVKTERFDADKTTKAIEKNGYPYYGFFTKDQERRAYKMLPKAERKLYDMGLLKLDFSPLKDYSKTPDVTPREPAAPKVSVYEIMGHYKIAGV